MQVARDECQPHATSLSEIFMAGANLTGNSLLLRTKAKSMIVGGRSTHGMKTVRTFSLLDKNCRLNIRLITYCVTITLSASFGFAFFHRELF